MFIVRQMGTLLHVAWLQDHGSWSSHHLIKERCWTLLERQRKSWSECPILTIKCSALEGTHIIVSGHNLLPRISDMISLNHRSQEVHPDLVPENGEPEIWGESANDGTGRNACTRVIVRIKWYYVHTYSHLVHVSEMIIISHNISMVRWTHAKYLNNSMKWD